jgi:hypothetical protein
MDDQSLVFLFSMSREIIQIYIMIIIDDLQHVNFIFSQKIHFTILTII